MEKYLANELRNVSLSMFRKDFIGIFHGSISARVEHNKFIINKKDAIFDDLKESDFIELYTKKDYRWKDASLDAAIHINIYKNINEAKYVCYAMPPFLTSYSLVHESITPRDYFGSQKFGTLCIYDPKLYDDWYERADIEIYRQMKENNSNVLIIKGYGVYLYERDIHQIAKNIALLENSAKLLYYGNGFEKDNLRALL